MRLTCRNHCATLARVLTTVIFAAGTSSAGDYPRNAGGTLVFHTNHQIYCADDGVPGSGLRRGRLLWPERPSLGYLR